MVGGHQRSGSVQPVIGPQGDRIGNHPVLASFDRSDGRGLRFDVQILVNDADSALWAKAMASGASVTVSMGADSSGIPMRIPLVRRVWYLQHQV